MIVRIIIVLFELFFFCLNKYNNTEIPTIVRKYYKNRTSSAIAVQVDNLKCFKIIFQGEITTCLIKTIWSNEGRKSYIVFSLIGILSIFLYK